MPNSNLYLDSAQKIIRLINESLPVIAKLKFEKFKDYYLLHVELPNSLLNITVRDVISVDLDSKLRQYTLDFYNNTISFKDVDEFELFFRSLDRSLVDKRSGIFVEYKNELIRCDVEISSFDSDRQMGLEVLYEVKFYDDELDEEIIAVEVSEYPPGFFSIYDSNSKVSYDEQDVLRYFHKQNENDIKPDFDF